MAFSGSLLHKNRSALEEIAEAMDLDHKAVKLRTELIDRIRNELLAKQDKFMHDDRFKKLYVKPKQGRPSSKPLSFKEEQDLTVSVRVPLTSSTPSSDHSDAPVTSSYLASQASSAGAKITSRRSPRLSSIEPASPRKHSQTSRTSVAGGTPSSVRRTSRLSGAGPQVSTDDEESEDDIESEEKETREGTPFVEDEAEGSFTQASAPLSELARPLSSALHSLTSPLKPALAALTSPLKQAQAVLASELDRARAVIDGAEDAVEGAVEGAGFKVVEVAHRAEARVTRAGRAIEARGQQAKKSVEHGVDRVVSLPQRAVNALKQATIGHPAFLQTAGLLAIEAAILFFALAPAQLHTASFPPQAPLLAAVDRRSDFAHIYPPVVRRVPWLTVVFPLPTWPTDPIGLFTAFTLWALGTIGVPAALAAIVSQPPTDQALVFWLLRAAVLALGHAGWRADGFGSGSGRAGLIGSLLGAGLGVARGLGEARVGGIRR